MSHSFIRIPLKQDYQKINHKFIYHGYVYRRETLQDNDKRGKIFLTSSLRLTDSDTT